MTLGRTPTQQDVLFGTNYCEEYLEKTSVFRLLHEHGDKLFPDEFFADLFHTRGRESVPPQIVATIMVLQRIHGLSDREAIQAFIFDVRWKYASGGLPLDYGGFDRTVLVRFRLKLRKSEDPDRIFRVVLEVAKEAGMIGRRRVLDSTALYDAVATQDTVTLIRSGIRGLLRVAPAELEEQLRSALKREDEYTGPGKPTCEWDDKDAREELVDALVHDAQAVLRVMDGKSVSTEVLQAAQLLASIIDQDIDEREDGTFFIARRVAKDRIISTVDPDARHGHKTKSRKFDGYKGHIAIDPDSEIITATEVTPGNVGDAVPAESLLKDVLSGQKTDDAADTDAANTDAANTDAANTDAADTDAADTDAADTDADADADADAAVDAAGIDVAVDAAVDAAGIDVAVDVAGIDVGIRAAVDAIDVDADATDADSAEIEICVTNARPFPSEDADDNVVDDHPDELCVENDTDPDGPIEVYGDASYGTADLQELFEQAKEDVKSYFKTQPPAGRNGLFGQDAFVITKEGGIMFVVCPNGEKKEFKPEPSSGRLVARFGKTCNSCPHREQCTKAKKGRTLSIHPKHEVLERARKEQADPDWQKQYRAVRPKVERKIGHLIRRGGRRSYVRGTERVEQEFSHLAAGTNLLRLAKLGLSYMSSIGWMVPSPV